jgi:YggT family protein
MVWGLSLLILLIDLYSLVVFVTVILSWVRLSPENPVVRVSTALVEPVLSPIRRVLPDLGGIDLSPMVLLIALRVVKSLVLGA